MKKVDKLSILLNQLYYLEKYKYINDCPSLGWQILIDFQIWLNKYNLQILHFYSHKRLAYHKKISYIYLVKYLLNKFDNDYQLLREFLINYHSIHFDYIFGILSDISIYNDHSIELKKFCANLLAEIIMENKGFVYPPNFRYLFHASSMEPYINYLSCIDISLIITSFMNDIQNNISKFNIDDIDILTKYYNCDLHPITFNQIHKLIIILLNKRTYIKNTVYLYKNLLQFNVLTDKEINKLKRKEARLIMKGLFYNEA